MISGYDCHSDGPLAQPKEVVMAKVAFCDARGPLNDLNDKISGDQGSGWLDRLKVMLRKNDLLRRVTEVTVFAVKKFAALDNFKVGNAGIVWLSDNFKTNFLGKIEKDVRAATLVASRLEKSSLDKDIRAELGTDKEETILAHLFQLLSRQSDGKPGILLTNGYANIFYVRDAKGNFWAVYAGWYSPGRGWHVYANPVNPDKWHGGHLVFSCK